MFERERETEKRERDYDRFGETFGVKRSNSWLQLRHSLTWQQPVLGYSPRLVKRIDRPWKMHRYIMPYYSEIEECH